MAAVRVLFADFELDRSAYELRRKGRVVRLQRIPLDLLLLLVERRGQLVTREEIIEKIWGKEIFLDAESSINTAVGKLRRALRDQRGSPRFIATVPAKGYRFIAEVSESLPLASADEAQYGNGNTAEQRALAGTKGRPVPQLSIVVLPFANLSGDAEQDYFVDGVTESLTTDLSRIPGSFVIARNSAFSYKGRAPEVRQIGRELGVRYVLEGSVQRGGNRMRVNVQLIDAETGNHLWAERFEKPVADLLDVQDQIVARLAGQLGTELVGAEARRAERLSHPDSMDLCFQGLAWTYKGWSPENLAKARGFFERALALDPNNLRALAGTAGVDSILGGSMMTDNPAAHFAAAEAAANKALSLAPNYARAHLSLGAVCNATNRAAQAIAECERALALDRNLAAAHWIIGAAKVSLGRAEETENHILDALRLSPRDIAAYIWLATAGAAKCLLGCDEEAVAWLRRSIEANRNWPLAHFYLSAALAHLGMYDEARAAAQAGLALDPSFTIDRSHALVMSDNPIYLAQRERLHDCMLIAGLPKK